MQVISFLYVSWHTGSTSPSLKTCTFPGSSRISYYCQKMKSIIYLLYYLISLNTTSSTQIWIPRYLKQALTIPKRRGSFHLLHVLSRSCEVRLLVIDLGQTIVPRFFWPICSDRILCLQDMRSTCPKAPA